MSYNVWLPATSFVVSTIFAVLVFKRYLYRHGTHLLFWGIGMVFYAIGSFAEAFYGAFGWNSLIFRLWYLFGAILVAAWLGQGTVYLLAKKKWAHTFMVLLAVGSIYGLIRVFTAELDPTLMTGSEMSGHAIVTDGVRILTPFFNIYGTITLVGGAAYSAWIFWRKRVLLHRTLGNILIAAGAMAPAFGGAFSRFGIPGALYVGELLGAIIMFAGFIRATNPIEEKYKRSRAQAASTD